jgi:hypothetical protein
MATIIAIAGPAGKGKSNTVLELARLLLNLNTPPNVIHTSKDIINLSIDFRLVMRLNNTTIALESQGDPGTHLQRRLTDIITTYSPDILITTCRTSGETLNAVRFIASHHVFDFIQTSTYRSAGNQAQLNRLKAEHLLNLLQQLGLI